jgi:hypothetical protein
MISMSVDKTSINGMSLNDQSASLPAPQFGANNLYHSTHDAGGSFNSLSVRFPLRRRNHEPGLRQRSGFGKYQVPGLYARNLLDRIALSSSGAGAAAEAACRQLGAAGTDRLRVDVLPLVLLSGCFLSARLRFGADNHLCLLSRGPLQSARIDAVDRLGAPAWSGPLVRTGGPVPDRIDPPRPATGWQLAWLVRPQEQAWPDDGAGRRHFRPVPVRGGRQIPVVQLGRIIDVRLHARHGSVAYGLGHDGGSAVVHSDAAFPARRPRADVASGRQPADPGLRHSHGGHPIPGHRA